MTTQKRLKALFIASALLTASAVFASGGYEDRKGCDKPRGEWCDKKMYKHHGYGRDDMNYRSHHKGGSSRFLIGAVYSLDLTKEQKGSIDKLIGDFQEKRAKRFEEFTKDGFDKEAYIKNRVQNREVMIKAKADLIEDIYGVLTKEQKKELKEELDDFKQMRSKRYGKDCNGRR